MKQKAHDEFVDWTLHTLIWIKKRWKSALEIVGLAVLVFVVVVGATHYWDWRSNTAAEAYYKTSLLKEDSDLRVKALEGVADDYLGTLAGKRALMDLGNIYLKKENYDLAAKKFQLLAGKSRNHPMLFVAAMYKLAETQAASGDAAAAVETYLKVAADPNNLISMNSRFKAAKTLEGVGEYEKAAGIYRQIIDEATEKDFFAKDKSEERLLWLMVRGHVQQQHS
ncbi:MAG: tetratricopeptide repeat protein [Deltaproteobacteria bacterium]|nr:tetratricopeptide repeat protein [Deltaproteobacteria bacterium]